MMEKTEGVGLKEEGPVRRLVSQALGGGVDLEAILGGLGDTARTRRDKR